MSDFPGLLPDILQAMVVFRDSGPDLISKSCVLLHVLAAVPQVGLVTKYIVKAKNIALKPPRYNQIRYSLYRFN